MARFVLALAAIAALSFANVAEAQEDEESTDELVEIGTDDKGRKVVTKRVHRVDFDQIDVNASVDGPSMGVGFELPQLTFNPLIRLRTNFDQEMLESLSEVQ